MLDQFQSKLVFLRSTHFSKSRARLSIILKFSIILFRFEFTSNERKLYFIKNRSWKLHWPFRWYLRTGGVAQMVERSLSMREVPGSIPGASKTIFSIYLYRKSNQLLCYLFHFYFQICYFNNNFGCMWVNKISNYITFLWWSPAP